MIIFLIGLTYSPRSNISYLYGSEFLEERYKLKYGAINFTFVGLMNAISALWFYTYKDQDSYFLFLIILITMALLWMYLFVPESPLYLFEKA